MANGRLEQILCLALILLGQTHSAPLSVLDSRTVEEIEPQARKQILEDFSGRSVLYQSLLPLNPNFELNIEVESPVITLKRPKNVAAKRQEVAERRIAEEARR